MPSFSLPQRGPFEVRLAQTPMDRDEVFRLRHRVLGDSESWSARGLTLSNGRLVEFAIRPKQLYPDSLSNFSQSPT